MRRERPGAAEPGMLKEQQKGRRGFTWEGEGEMNRRGGQGPGHLEISSRSQGFSMGLN